MQGDSEAHKLISAHYEGAHKFLCKFTRRPDMARDILHDACVKVLKKFDSLKDKNLFKAWFYSIAVNEARNTFSRKMPKRKNESEKGLSILRCEKDWPDKHLEIKEFDKKLLEEIATLPPRQGRAFSLRILDLLSFQDIAEIMNCPYDTAKANYRHGLTKIKSKNLEF